MSELKFHPKAFSIVFEMPSMSPAAHIAAVDRMLAQWEREKKKAERGATSKVIAPATDPPAS